MNIIDPWNMSDIFAVYEELLKSNEGDIVVKLKDGKQLKVISCNRRGCLEAFREFMAYIYYNKTYTGSYLPLLFEILSITDYYNVDAYRT
ncbi:hypothetical protein BGW39_001335, partial [Mortierella sp. 14UC]